MYFVKQPRSRPWFCAAGVYTAAAIIAAVMLIIWLLPASGHSWYPAACCAENHCHPVPCDELLERSDGSWTWYTFTFNRQTVKPSEDRYCHVCTIGPNGVCAFIQQGA